MSEMTEKMINGLLEYAHKAADFSAEQIPLVVEEVLAWNFWLSLVKFVVHVGVTTGLVACLPKMMKQWVKWGELYGSADALLAVKTVIFSVLAFVTFMTSLIEGFNLDWLQITIAPRIWLIEYASELVE